MFSFGILILDNSITDPILIVIGFVLFIIVQLSNINKKLRILLLV